MRAGQCPAVRMIFKAPQQPTGMTYVGSITLPFRDFSFVIKVQCPERGWTGSREAMLLARRMAQGAVPVSEGRIELPGWDPDAEDFDAEFPGHPVSRARRVLRRVAESLAIDPPVAGLPGFRLPQVGSGP